MVNLIKKIQSLFGIGETKTKVARSTLDVVTKVWYEGGTWNRSMCRVPTTFFVDPLSIGSKLLGEDAKLKLFQVTDVTLSLDQFKFKVGKKAAVWNDKFENWQLNPEIPGLYSWAELVGDVKVLSSLKVKLSLGATLPEGIISGIVRNAVNYLNQSGGYKHMIPAHPRWVLDKGCINILCSDKPMNIPNSMLIRAGKDMWNEVLVELATKSAPLKLLVLPSTGSIEGDGNFFLTRSAGRGLFGLIRGAISIQKEVGIIKGRIISTDVFRTLPDGSELPEGIDGWTTVDNIKWLSSDKLASITNKVVEVKYLNLVKDEDHVVKEDGYRFHSLAMPLMRKTQETYERMKKDFLAHWLKGSDRIKNLSIEQMLADLKDDTNGHVLSSQAVKMFKGIATPADIKAVKSSYAKKFASWKIKGSEYPAIIFARKWAGIEVTPDSPVWSPELFARLTKDGSLSTTLSRYPLVSHQSYLWVDLEKVAPYGDVLVDYVVLHPDCAPYIQGDGDDHALVQSRYMSTFRPSCGEKVDVVKPKVREGEVDPALAYIKGAKAQGSIGYAFNAMIKALVLGMDQEFQTAAMAINAFAQGVKKDAILPEASELIDGISKEFANATKDECSFEVNLAGMVASKNDPEKFEYFLNQLGYDFEFNFEVPEQVEESVYEPKVDTFAQAKQIIQAKETMAVKAAGFPHVGMLKATIARDPELWTVSDWCQVVEFFAEYNEMAMAFKGKCHYRESGLVASQIKGTYLAIESLLNQLI